MEVAENEIHDINHRMEFDVYVEMDSGNFAGRLILDPSGISLSVMGDISQARHQPMNGWKVNNLRCSDMHYSFNLFNLSIARIRSRRIPQNGNQHSFYEATYDVESVLIKPEQGFSNDKLTGFTIESTSIREWLGITTLQHALLEATRKGKDDEIENNEFELEIEEYGWIICGYSCQNKWSLQDISMSTEVKPSLSVVFNNPIDAYDLLKEVHRLYSLLSFLFGKEFRFDAIYVHRETPGRILSKAASFYFKTSVSTKASGRGGILFPLNRKMIPVHQNGPEFMLESFVDYYMLESKKQGCFEKYLTYRRRYASR